MDFQWGDKGGPRDPTSPFPTSTVSMLRNQNGFGNQKRQFAPQGYMHFSSYACILIYDQAHTQCLILKRLPPLPCARHHLRNPFSPKQNQLKNFALPLSRTYEKRPTWTFPLDPTITPLQIMPTTKTPPSRHRKRIATPP